MLTTPRDLHYHLNTASHKVEESLVLDMIKARGIKVASIKGSSGLALADLEPNHPEATQKRVHVDEDNNLVWPVLFLYPEFGETDFIEKFRENDLFWSHLEIMFGAGAARPPWDKDNKSVLCQKLSFTEFKHLLLKTQVHSSLHRDVF